MSLRTRPDPEDLATLLAGRVDTLEQQLGQITVDVAALGRGVGDLTTQIRKLTTTLTPDTTGPAGDPVAVDGDDEMDGQPDWFAVTDPDTALEILTVLTTWVQTIGRHHGITLPITCWVLHPHVVAALLALATERDHAYTGARPTPVSEWLTRWLPATATTISTGLAACVAVRGHWARGLTYDLTGFDPLSAGPWWATDRDTPAVTAFALPPLT